MAKTLSGFQTVTEAAKRIGCTRSWIHQLLEAGRIDGAIQLSGNKRSAMWLIPKSFKYSAVQRTSKFRLTNIK